MLRIIPTLMAKTARSVRFRRAQRAELSGNGRTDLSLSFHNKGISARIARNEHLQSFTIFPMVTNIFLPNPFYSIL
jgi:ABC-type Na+ transport system ATPase subunit NatA